ncbi:MAG TPA: TatD family hydrolase [Thermoanaerobaculia bacterium]|nr:TatD family hydrolase [Thermoanaerobaculia bacterium]
MTPQVDMRLTDSHCHLTMSDAGALLARAREGGVRGFVVPGTNLADGPRALEIATQNEGVWAAVGFHPHEAKDCDDAAFAEIERLARDPRVVAIGEVGLDYHYMQSPRETQREVLLRHLDLADRLGKPVIIHNRESTDDLLEIVQHRRGRGILHSFTESYEVAARLIDRGYFISFSGIVTFRSAEALRACARKLPLDRVLIETDTPYLAPVPFRGRDNEPAYVVKVAELLASLQTLPPERVAAVTTANFERAFSVTVPQ